MARNYYGSQDTYNFAKVISGSVYVGAWGMLDSSIVRCDEEQAPRRQDQASDWPAPLASVTS